MDPMNDNSPQRKKQPHHFAAADDDWDDWSVPKLFVHAALVQFFVLILDSILIRASIDAPFTWILIFLSMILSPPLVLISWQMIQRIRWGRTPWSVEDVQIGILSGFLSVFSLPTISMLICLLVPFTFQPCSFSGR